MDAESKKIWKQRIGLYAGVLAILLVCWVFIWAYRSITIRRYGAELHPKKQVQCIQPAFWSMENALYAQEPMGDTGYTIGQQGSLLCCLCMAADAQGVALSPSDLNGKDMYDGNAYRLDGISEIPGLEKAVFEAYTSFAEDRVREILGEGEACLARVLRDGNVHWLCVTGTQDEAFIVLDPAGSGEAEPLEERVYALGRLRFR